MTKPLTNKEKKRKAIIRDVIAQIEASKYNVKRGNYVTGDAYQITSSCSLPLSEQSITKRDVKILAQNCEVCALGSLFLSKIKCFNNSTWNESGIYINRYEINIGDHEIFIDSFSEYFSREELAIIEAAFELNLRDDFYREELEQMAYEEKYEEELDNFNKKVSQAISFGQCFGNESIRLLAIMQNMLDHRSYFKPEVQYFIEYE